MAEHIDATLNDLHKQNEAIIGLLERLNENIFLIREAVYGQTQDEARASGMQGRFDNPKHGHFGAVAESTTELETLVLEIADHLKK